MIVVVVCRVVVSGGVVLALWDRLSCSLFSVFSLWYAGVVIDNVAYSVLLLVLLLSFVFISLSIQVFVCMVLLFSIIYVMLYMVSLLSYHVHV